MAILETVNHFWPNTIAKLALTQDALPNGTPFMGYFVELFEGKSLPTETEVTAKIADYDVFLTTEAANAAIKKQIAALEGQQTPRRIREAIKGTDNGWMVGIDNQIAALRAQLT